MWASAPTPRSKRGSGVSPPGSAPGAAIIDLPHLTWHGRGTSSTVESKSPRARAENMAVPTLESLKVKLFTDGADKVQIVDMAKNRWIAGFTTNPSLLKKAGVK